jgi:16S rRNA C967 or C1407 C5-methylase (RsmB/RsmF family)/NOL1/NOP2/fmu family ribosome biogenesis protein
MTHLPDSLINSLTGTSGFDRSAFEKVHASGEQVTSVRLNPRKTFDSCLLALSENNKVPWTDHGYYLDSRPSFTFDPLFHAGCYYVQEASSMFLEQALNQTVDLSVPLTVLDLSAAPGGKSTHILSLILPESLLVSNEVIRSRANVLTDNLIKWGASNAMVTNNDPKDFGRLPGFFDVIVVDAPCSGSGLFRRDASAIEEWSPNNVSLCSQRQQRILADVWPALKENGILIYSTCSYSIDENENIVEWMRQQLDAVYCPLTIDGGWGIVESASGYRFWPDRLKGEGFFLSVVRKTTPEYPVSLRAKTKQDRLSQAEIDTVTPWLGPTSLKFVKHENTVFAWPEQLENRFSFLLNHLRPVYSGTIIGELFRDKLVPHHALSMSHLQSETLIRSSLDYDTAIQYLQRKDIPPRSMPKGWQMVTYEGQILGWVNVLANRINNYYPKDSRILKDNPSLPGNT